MKYYWFSYWFQFEADNKRIYYSESICENNHPFEAIRLINGAVYDFGLLNFKEISLEEFELFKELHGLLI